MVKLIGSLRALKPIRVLVIGDFVVDTYVIGKVNRVSPEAPVPILKAESKTSRPGMAGNVALNLCSLGASVEVVGRRGHDVEGRFLQEFLQSESIDTSGLIFQEGYETPVKIRMIANAQQLIRIDHETDVGIDEATKLAIIQHVKARAPHINVIAISDYLKGLFTDDLLQQIISIGKEHQIPVIVDPKGHDFSKYRFATLIKPNNSEAYVAAKCSSSVSLDIVAKKLLEESEADYLLITRSELGMSIFTQDGSREDFPVKVQEVKDVTGAGDTVLSVIAMALGNDLSLDQAVSLANIAASIAIQKIGCARISLADIAERLLELDTTSKLFDEDHLFALEQVLARKPFVILGLHIAQEMTTALFQMLKKLKKENPEHALVIYLKETEQNQDLIDLLTSLHEVDFIILESHSLHELCLKISPQQTLLFRETLLVEMSDPKKLLMELTPLARIS